MQKKILITSALSQELNIVKKKIKSLKISKKEIVIDYFTFGVGNYKTIANLTHYLSLNKYDFIVNVGVCGYVDDFYDLIQIARIVNVHTFKELLVPIFFEFCKLKSISCSENIVSEKALLGDEKFVDMESYGFELVCEKFNIARIILKIPVDKVGNETKYFDYDKAYESLEKNIDYDSLISEIIKYLDKLPVKLNLDKYFNHFKMTFSEKIIFNNLYNKYIALIGNDFDMFFNQNKELSKKDFFKLLEEK